MSRYFPHTPYAEDQPLAHAILATHVATRAVTTGSVLGLAITGARSLFSRPSSEAFSARLLRSCANSTVITLGVVGVGLAGRMWGREAVEWQDRSWRLLENRGQVETDDWTYAGAGAAALAAGVVTVRSRGAEAGRKPAVAALGWRGVVGAAGLGSVGGMLGYLGWRYGVNGGKTSDSLMKKEERTGL